MKPFQIFIGWDSKEPDAFAVLADSILRQASQPVSIVPLALRCLKEHYWRPRGGKESTEFSISRFLVPYLSNFDGYSLFMDCDMLVQFDICDVMLYPLADPGKAVYVCPHDYTPKTATKFLGQEQTVYPRKNWSSFMVFDNARCQALTPDYVNTATGLQLHRFQWTTDDQLGFLPLDLNHLVGEYESKPDARILHWTLGGPWFDRRTDHADRWFAARAKMLGETHA